MSDYKRYITAALLGMSVLTTSACTGNTNPSPNESETSGVTEIKAFYLGVKDYGKENVDKDHIEEFKYRFEVDGKEVLYSIDNSAKDADGNPAYPIQNVLKENYLYQLSVKDDTVTDAYEIPANIAPYISPVKGTPGEMTLTNFLKTALMPVGTTLYMYGGGWDWQDTGTAINAKSFGVSTDWVRFFNEHDENYTYDAIDDDDTKVNPSESYFPYGGYNEYYYAGLDCSGYVGWTEYNFFETEEGQPGYVRYADEMAKDLAERGYGEWTQDIKFPDGNNGYEMKPGDVMSIDGHVWISLGTCDDGSVVILHSTPSKSRTGQPGGGVQISAIGIDQSCEAYKLTEQYMSEYYPVWSERYPAKLCSPEIYFTFEGDASGRFTWDTSGNGRISDPDELQQKKPAEVLEILFGETEKIIFFERG